MTNEQLNCAIARIQAMEQQFDSVSQALDSAPDRLKAPDIRSAVQALRDYYTNGQWLCDYELDELRLLPHNLKRGVLSQDGLYNLLCALDELPQA